MKNLISRISIFAFLTITTMACSGSDDNAAPSNNGAASFTWTENGSATVKTATSTAFWNVERGGVKASLNGVVAVELAVFINAVGVNTLRNGITSDALLTQNLVSPAFNATGGTITITENSATKISGTFDVTGPAQGGITSMKGTFTNIPK